MSYAYYRFGGEGFCHGYNSSDSTTTTDNETPHQHKKIKET